jgi:hypothetical protein
MAQLNGGLRDAQAKCAYDQFIWRALDIQIHKGG